jgi:N6-adenosine-specific RNA methylase IME4
MVLEEGVDWDEVRELVTESCCVLAPKKLVARVDRPGWDTRGPGGSGPPAVTPP